MNQTRPLCAALLLVVSASSIAACGSDSAAPACATPDCDEDVTGTTDSATPDDSASPPTEDVEAEVTVCTPACATSDCGDDGCGGSCGDCAQGTLCSAGTCLAYPEGFVAIPAGTFTMGSPDTEPCPHQTEKPHEVTLTRAFLLKTTEVTQAEWQALMETSPSAAAGCDECPVEQVTWWSALAYCNALSAAEGLEVCYSLTSCEGTPGVDFDCALYSGKTSGDAPLDCDGYRLPTEAEWEYSARAGTTTGTYQGDLEDLCYGASAVLDPIAWYESNSEGTPHPVATREPNAWGLYDMLGNVSEWTWDVLDQYTDEPVTDPCNVPHYQGARIRRGGGWDANSRFCRVAYRNGGSATYRGANQGLRPARTIP